VNYFAITLQLLYISLKSFKTKPVYSNYISNCMPQNNEHVISVCTAKAQVSQT